MGDARWRRVQDLYHAALERPVSVRAEFLSEECAGDAGLLHEVQSLLDQPISAEQFLVAGESSPGDTSSVRIGQLTRRLSGRGANIGAAGWARSTVRGTRSSVATSRSRCCRQRSRRPRSAGALRARSAHAGVAEPSAHRRDLRLERRRLGVRRWCWSWSKARRSPIASRAGRCRSTRHCRSPADRRGARGGPREGHHPSRSEARQHQDHARRHGEGARLRAGEGRSPAMRRRICRSSPTMTATTHGRDSRNRRLHVARSRRTGKAVDKRSDMWAFGCVLYEMLTGRRAFEGDTVSEILAAILEDRAGLAAAACRDADEHPASAAPLPAEGSEAPAPRHPRRASRDRRCQSGDAAGRTCAEIRSRTAGAARLGVGARACRADCRVLGVRALRPAPAAPETRLEINTPPTRDRIAGDFARWTEDCLRGQVRGPVQLWLRSLDSSSARPLAGTERASRRSGRPTAVRSGSLRMPSSSAWTSTADRSGHWRPPLRRLSVARGTATARSSFRRTPADRFSASPLEGGEPAAVTRFESPQQRSHSVPAVPPRWPALPLLRDRQPRSPWRLYRPARRIGHETLVRRGCTGRVCRHRPSAVRP